MALIKSMSIAKGGSLACNWRRCHCVTHIGAMGGTQPWLSIDRLFIDSAPIREPESATHAANGNMRVDAIAMARLRAPNPPEPT